MKKRFSKFYVIYFACILFFIVALSVFLVWLNSAIKDYNKTLPETIAEEFFLTTFKTVDAERILELSGDEPTEFETKEDLKSYIEKELNTPLTYTSIATTDSTKKQYIVKAGEFKVADFTLTKSENSWQAHGVNLYLPKGDDVSVTLLSSSTLYINSTPVDDSYVTHTEPHTRDKYLTEDMTKHDYVTYTIPGLTKTPDIKVVDRNENTPTLTEKDGVFVENVIYDEVEDAIVERILTGAKQYAICMQNDATKSSVFPYFEKGTELYKRILSVETIFAWDHNGYDFEDVETSEYFRLDDKTVSLRVKFVHILKKYGREDYRNPTDITYLAREIDGEYMIFASYNN